ncbi:uncharacterized protein L3040_007708 [Drepanopeziza brunnea f. sp. 'multigermtubi']|uniref:Uncharacterized protein n=1 Tax=Marssonina brunnea f. sp. multigermtubi (strain MB_m1) TaxID=1072389 RepID=K1WZP0_MARBU|nr:uncharacterized protein MBM_03884 [Drepanopeziza brunnea f. sp. 'multigermtubi' MB_m1]EKD18112.1 hypothetical protein MBM_03884 [Drepanopeziza brunnea f. sp. 'multigermtubi' MB_m1]KAJ5037536.1 hypothetical protein L3040_007708 [Drepanopeziza brunnea f. sp. 'multigermtubi']
MNLPASSSSLEEEKPTIGKYWLVQSVKKLAAIYDTYPGCKYDKKVDSRPILVQQLVLFDTARVIAWLSEQAEIAEMGEEEFESTTKLYQAEIDKSKLEVKKCFESYVNTTMDELAFDDDTSIKHIQASYSSAKRSAKEEHALDIMAGREVGKWSGEEDEAWGYGRGIVPGHPLFEYFHEKSVKRAREETKEAPATEAEGERKKPSSHPQVRITGPLLENFAFPARQQRVLPKAT